jgi:hypothetical protein
MQRVELAAIVAAWKSSIGSPSDARILPKVVLERRDWPPGTKLVVENHRWRFAPARAAVRRQAMIRGCSPCSKTDGRRRTVEDMDSAVLKRIRPQIAGARGHYLRFSAFTRMHAAAYSSPNAEVAAICDFL